MKAITISEPWASLISFGKKRIETRTWKTSYRGTLYIHAGRHVDKNWLHEQRRLVSPTDIPSSHPGFILARCELIDCCEMTSDFIQKVKQNNFEFQTGVYELGRYAWILRNVQTLAVPVECKGHLRVWNIPAELSKEIEAENDK
ncbi:ASCH domain-containing protein [Pediococcus ethanolidurans]|nr:ASCH domain-containing protein [Pediococcus ethanolidurans]GEN95930.1 hypothetical protein PET01_19800 [Pediococcus ethanolidurans]SER91227.1 ASCH domain-containing protein [Pediococcus ethanolidurans]